MVRITKAQFDYFKKCCEEFIDVFSLRDWAITYVQSDIDERGRAAWRLEGYRATIALCIEWDDTINKPTNQELRETAFHEVTHLLLARLQSNANYRHAQESEIVESIEEIIRRITNAFLYLKKH